ncbi:type II toxin-antitoxin system Phd/YefM family antitoxin [Streptomyces albidoflavus]
METITSTAAARRIGEIFSRAARGETFLITQYGRPYATVGPPVAEEPEPPTPKKRAARKAPAKKSTTRPPG